MGPRLLVIACGALAREVRDILTLNGLGDVQYECLPASLHLEPDKIPDAVRSRIRAAGDKYDRILVGYADCGTGGLLDVVCEEEGVERLPGAHCYEFFAGSERFAKLHEAEIGTFYLTDYLAKHFERLVWRGFWLDRHPELRDLMFGGYTRVVLLAQTDDPAVTKAAFDAAGLLGLPLEIITAGYGELTGQLVQFSNLGLVSNES